MTNRIHFSGTFEKDPHARRKLAEAIQDLDPDAADSLPDWIAYRYVLSDEQSILVAYALHHDWGVHADSLDGLIQKIRDRIQADPGGE